MSDLHQRDRRVVPPLRFSTKLAYGLGQGAMGIKNFAFNIFLLFYYSQVLGLDPVLASAVLFISLGFDAITDPLAGSISDSLRSRLGRRHGFMYASAIPMALAFYFVWSPPSGLGQLGLGAWMLTWTVLSRGASTLFSVPHWALGAELSADYAERTRVVAYRNFFNFVGGSALVLVARTVMMQPSPEFASGQLNPAAYGPLGLWFGLAAAVLILISTMGTHDRIPYLPTASGPVTRFSLARLTVELREALRNRSLRWFLISIFLFFVAQGVDLALGLYMGTYFWKLGSNAITVPLAGLIGIVIGTPAWAMLADRLEKRPAFMIGIAGYSGFTMLLPIAKLVGAFPSEESAAYLPSIYFFALLASAFGAGAALAGPSMLADIADQHELETGRRQEGVFFGALSLSFKSSLAIGSGLAGLALSALDFPLQAAVEDVDPWMVTQLALIYGPVVLVLVVISLVVFSRYDLTRERHAEIRAALDLRQQRGPSAGAATVLAVPAPVPSAGGAS